MIDLTPLEVRKKKGDFRRTMRGYEPGLVDDFLDLVADRLEQLVRDHLAMTERLARLEQQTSEFRERERALMDALVSAQEMREDMRKQTTREAELTRRTAEQEAAALRREAQTEASRVRSEAVKEREREADNVRRLRARQEQFLTSYQAFLERELSELRVVSKTLGMTTLADAADPMAEGTESAPAVAPSRARPPAAAPPAAPLPFAPLDADDVGLALEEDLGPVRLEEEPGEDVEGEREDIEFLALEEDEVALPLEEEDEGDATILLRNAEAAGYRLDARLTDAEPGGDGDEELLLDETIAEETGDQSWLPSLLNEEEK